MPKLSEIVRTGEPAIVYHPICGFYRWEPVWPESEYCSLVKCVGPEKGQLAEADEVVLLDEDWVRSDEAELAEWLQDQRV